MKVLLVNGSPHQDGCTHTALRQLARGLEEQGIETVEQWIGTAPIKGCCACGNCRKTKRCDFGSDDGVNEMIERMQGCDGLVLGSPVHFAGITGALKCLLDRAFFAAGTTFALKPAACLVSARRAGTTAALEQLQKFPQFAQMPLVSSFYWPMVHGRMADEALLDEEGMDICYQLGLNMAWMLRSIDAGQAAGLMPLKSDSHRMTNFVR